MRSFDQPPAAEPAAPFDYRHVLEALTDPVVAANASNQVIYANAAVGSLLGWAPEDLIGRPLVTIIPPRLRDTHVAAFERYMLSGQARIIGHPTRVPALARDGTEVDIELTLTAFSAPDGSRFVVASLRDLRDRIELERQLAITRYLQAVTRASARITSLLDLDRVLDTIVTSLVEDFDAALARIWLYDRGGHTLELRARAGLMTEIEHDGLTHIDVETYPYKLADVAQRREPFIQNGLLGDPQFDQEWVRTDGIESAALFPLLYGEELLGVVSYFSRMPIRDEVVEALKAFITITTTAIHDVRLFREEQHYLTQSVRAEQRSTFLARAGEVLGSSLDYTTTLRNVAHLAVTSLADWCLVDVLESDGEVRRLATAHVDPEWMALADEFEERYPRQDRESAALTRVIETGAPVLVPHIQPQQIETAARSEEHLQVLRRLAPLSYMCVPLSLRDRVLGAITFLTTEASGRIYTQADLTLAEELARRAAVAVDNSRVYGELQEAIRVRDEFLSSVSHDLKNPLAAIKARAQLLRRRATRIEGGVQLVEGLESIDRTAERMTRLINDLVDLVHLRIGRPLALHRESTDLHELVRQVIADQRESAPGRAIRMEGVEGPVPASVDAARIERVLVNLISNAVKYSPEGGEVAVSLSTEEIDGTPTALITVADSGIGIPPEDLSHIFERFYRASNAVSFAGTGIGLAAALQIVEQHKGTITAESRPGEGTTFTVRLPLADPRA